MEIEAILFTYSSDLPLISWLIGMPSGVSQYQDCINLEYLAQLNYPTEHVRRIHGQERIASSQRPNYDKQVPRSSAGSVTGPVISPPG